MSSYFIQLAFPIAASIRTKNIELIDDLVSKQVSNQLIGSETSPTQRTGHCSISIVLYPVVNAYFTESMLARWH